MLRSLPLGCHAIAGPGPHGATILKRSGSRHSIACMQRKGTGGALHMQARLKWVSSSDPSLADSTGQRSRFECHGTLE
ncbi:hypothetical protein Nepgr_033493 [Nepenthes gracilis]|uniref:Uncharacterized protein n=1 Tax=Nepenthes gracilis TaxID=150966 RepID=A0AAD3Y8P9_NEPGR|nr:hypothetical protein Nepgr_033493 [Nepenthes gracilis]